MPSPRSRLVVAAALCLVLPAAIPAAAWDGDRTLLVEIDGEDGNDLTFSLGGDLFGGLIAAALDESLECEAETDPEMRRLLLHLDRQGEGSKGRVTDRDGDEIRAWRRGGHLEMDVRERDGERAELTLPWAIAECMLGREVALGEVLTGRGGDLKLQVRDSQGGGLKVSLQSE